MTLPTVNLAASAIQTEYGGSNPVALSEYYSACTNVATSGTIKYAQFLGTTKPASGTTRLDAETLVAHGIHSATCNTVFFANGTSQQIVDGDITATGAGSYTWLQGGAAGDYEIKATKTAGTAAGTFSSGWANDTWAAMSTNRNVSLTRTAFGVATVTLSISIRYTSNSTVINTATTSMSSEADK
jgi:hypothetical protein